VQAKKISAKPRPPSSLIDCESREKMAEARARKKLQTYEVSLKRFDFLIAKKKLSLKELQLEQNGGKDI